MKPWAILAAAGALLLATRTKTDAAPAGARAFTPAPATPGGKNLVDIPGMPAAPYRTDLPQAIHYYAQDMPLVIGDRGNLVDLVQRMLGYRGLTVPVTGVMDAATMATAGAAGYTSLDLFAGPLTEAIHSADLHRLATERPALVGTTYAYPFKPAEG